MKRLDPEARRAAIALLRRGAITAPEAMRCAGVSRQTLRYWCLAAGLSWELARDARIAKLWRSELNRGSRQRVDK